MQLKLRGPHSRCVQLYRGGHYASRTIPAISGQVQTKVGRQEQEGSAHEVPIRPRRIDQWTLCAQADQSWTRGEHKGTISSGEGLACAVRDAMYRDEPLKERGRPTGEMVRICVETGVEDKRLFLVQAEFGVVL